MWHSHPISRSFPRIIRSFGSINSSYQLIYNSEEIRRWASLFLSQLGGERSKLLCLLPRNKYRRPGTPAFQDHEITLPRTVVQKNDPDYFLSQIKGYETPIGSYVVSLKEETGVIPVPPESLALYLTLNTKSSTQAWEQTNQELENYLQGDPNILQGEPFPLEECFKSHLYQSPSLEGERFFDLDVDTKEERKIESLQRFLKGNNIPVRAIIETHGGYYLVFHEKMLTSEQKQRLLLWCSHTKFTKIDEKGSPWVRPWATLRENSMIPVPGCLQGGFQGRLVEWK